MSVIREFWSNVVRSAPGAPRPGDRTQHTEETVADGSLALQSDAEAPVLSAGPVAQASPAPGAPGPSNPSPPTGAASVREEELDATIAQNNTIPEHTNKERVKELVKLILERLEQELAKSAVQQRISQVKEQAKTNFSQRNRAVEDVKRIILDQMNRTIKQVADAEQPTTTADPEFHTKIQNSVVSSIVARKLVKERAEQMARDLLGDLEKLDPSELDQVAPQSRREQLIAELRRIPQDISWVQGRIKSFEQERAKCEEQAAQLTETYARTKEASVGKKLNEIKQRIKKLNDDIKDYQDEAERAFPEKERKLLGDIAKEPLVSRDGHISLLERWLSQRYPQETHPELYRHGRVE